MSQAIAPKPVVVPDLYGRRDLLDAVIRAHFDRDLVYLGNYLGAAGDSRAVLSEVLALQTAGRATLLLGNHEALAREVLAGGRGAERMREVWYRHGGWQTLASYDFDERALVADLERLYAVAREWLVLGDALLAHAARPHPDVLSGRNRRNQDHLWDRAEDGLQPLPAGCSYSVHGHSVVARPQVLLGTPGVVYLNLGPASRGIACFDLESRRAEVVTLVHEGSAVAEPVAASG